MTTYQLTVALLLFVMVGCSDTPDKSQSTVSNAKVALVDGATVELIGVAASVPDLGDKAMTDAVIQEGVRVQFDGQYEQLPDTIMGLKIKVTGTLRLKRAPMFIYDERVQGAVPQGIPMPPGTDIEKESAYFVIENPQWQQLDRDHADAG